VSAAALTRVEVDGSNVERGGVDGATGLEAGRPSARGDGDKAAADGDGPQAVEAVTSRGTPSGG
jgi:hypothetical protein